MKIGSGGFPLNSIFHVSLFNFYIGDPISVKLRNRAVTRTNITVSGINRSYRTFHAPSLLRIPHALHWPPLQCCRGAGEWVMSTALTKRG